MQLSLCPESPAVPRYSADSEQSLKRRQMRKQKSDATVARFLRELRSYTLPGSSGERISSSHALQIPGHHRPCVVSDVCHLRLQWLNVGL